MKIVIDQIPLIFIYMTSNRFIFQHQEIIPFLNGVMVCTLFVSWKMMSLQIFTVGNISFKFMKLYMAKCMAFAPPLWAPKTFLGMPSGKI